MEPIEPPLDPPLKGGIECGREELSVEMGKMKGRSERESHIPG